MNIFTEWLENFTVFTLLYGLVMELVPSKKYEAYVKLFMGFFFLAVMLYPVMKIGPVGTVFQEQLEHLTEEQKQLERQAERQSERLFFTEISGTPKKDVQKESIEDERIRGIDRIDIPEIIIGD
ncbi:MAG: stage III sporulation protein AF [Lachnospiraceae bacterium]